MFKALCQKDCRVEVYIYIYISEYTAINSEKEDQTFP